MDNDKLLVWHFSAAATLANGDGRAIRLGDTLTVEGQIHPCYHGLHGSASALDALRYAPGPILWRCALGGAIVPHGDPVDKYAASERTAVAGGVDVTPMLRDFARQCALDVVHLWDCPPIVKEYLTTGDESLWAAAWDAARGAARAAAWDAARAAAWGAAWAAARAAARGAAWDAARGAQRARFEVLCLAAVGGAAA